jgi:ATP synthase protein I
MRMSIKHAQLRQYTRRLLLIQVLMLSVAAGITFFRYGSAASGALLYGGFIAIAGTLILIRSTRRAERTGSNPAANAGLIYGTAISRLATAIGLFAVGFAVLRLPPLPLLLGFVVGQVAQLVSTAFVSGKTRWRATR